MLLIDTDIVLFKAATTAEVEVDWGSDVFSLWSDLRDAKASFETQLTHIKDKTGQDDCIFCLSDPDSNFRKLVDPSYKSNRRKTRKPVGYKALVQWVKDTFPTFSKPSLEADDCMALLATKDGNQGKCIIVSDDKDMLSVPSELYRPTKDERLTVTEQEADKFVLMQTLIGDPVDGYKGVPGIGPKKAEALLGIRPAWSAVEQAFLKAGLTKQDAIIQARLARILRWSDWDDEKGEVKLWTPDT